MGYCPPPPKTEVRAPRVEERDSVRSAFRSGPDRTSLPLCRFAVTSVAPAAHRRYRTQSRAAGGPVPA
jgi:hypothetical protein